jgi:hypothetical protein
MKITAVKVLVVPASSPTRNAFVDLPATRASVVAVFSSVVRDGQPVELKTTPKSILRRLTLQGGSPI